MRPIADNIWIHDSKLAAGPFGTFRTWGARMTRFGSHGLFLHSPVKLDAELKREIDELGPVAAIVAPNRLHHLFVADYFAAYPMRESMRRPDFRKNVATSNFTAHSATKPAPEWSRQLEQHFVSGASLMNETVFFHPSSRTW